MSSSPPAPRWGAYLLLLGLFLTCRGYRAFEGDQAYRLPAYLHGQDASLYAFDPFVGSFGTFNPHRGAFGLLGLASWPFGLAAGLAGLFVVTFLATCFGLDRLARAVWNAEPPTVGLVAVGLALSTLAGNIGTNHLFEPILLDRLMAFALGWLALATRVRDPDRGLATAAVCLALAAVVHPTLGLQLAALLAGGELAWWVFGLGPIPIRTVAYGLAVAPGLWLNLRGSAALAEGLPTDLFRTLAVELQGPQHMLPHLWRRPQWLAWGCFALLALLTEAVPLGPADDPRPRRRLVALLAVNLMGLAVAWWGIERLGHLRLTLFQPFRLATVARGLSLVLLAGHVQRLWTGGTAVARTRALLLLVGLTGDWRMVVVTAFEASVVGLDRVRTGRWHQGLRLVPWAVLAWGIVFMARHDTESGHIPVAVVAVVGLVGFRLVGSRPFAWDASRRRRWMAAAWAVPAAAAVLAALPSVPRHGWAQALVRKCRFGETPVDDVERLALWCRRHTPLDARFVGPPGPKGFRLWSRRSLAFNRAGSPYTARGLADWAERYRDHVGVEGSLDDFVRTYQRDRHGLERRYDTLDPDGLASLAARQGATHVVARRDLPIDPDGRLEPLHVEGSWAVYRVVTPPPAPPVLARKSR